MASTKDGDMFQQNQLTSAYFEDEIKTSFLNYAYSVITSRAIPDVRDGMKPVQRRILYTMGELSLWRDKPTKKSARIVGDVMGKYHPHGDSSIYMAMVKQAQEFHMRYPLVIGQGNFGSIDDDPPAAMRYTEAKMSRVAEYILRDLDKNTVNFKPNYDDTLQEPGLLPGMFPNLLCNGTSGIAVGLATDIPPHNYKEVAAGIKAFINNPKITVTELMQHIKGPDFPTAGLLTSPGVIREVYETGTGSIELAGKMTVEEHGGHKSLVITEIPYRVIKSKLVEEITNLYLNTENKYRLILEGIKEVRDESSKEGIRVVIELYRDANAEAIRTALYNQTAMKTRVKVNMTVLIKNQPKLLPLPEIIRYYVEHRLEVIVRRTQFDLDKALARIHIVEGLLIALDNIDEVIKVIKTSKDKAAAKTALMERFRLSDIQADAILEMRLHTLTNLETNKLKEEKKELEALIKDLREILASPERQRSIIKDELDEMDKEIGDARRTQFDTLTTEKIEAEELISNDPFLLTVSKKGFLIREVGATLKTGSRGTRGRKGDVTDTDKLESDDFIFATVSGYMKDTILFATDSGRVYSLKAYEIRGVADGKITRGHIQNIERLKEISIRGESITAVLVVTEFTANNFILFATRKGRIARIPLSEFDAIIRTGINAVKLRTGDLVASAVITDGSKKLFVIKNNAKGFRFDESLFPVHGRYVGGEKGTSVSSVEEEVMGMALADEDKYVLFITRDGRGRKVKPVEFNELVNRGGKGYKLMETGKNRVLASFTLVEDCDQVVITTRNGRRVSITVDNLGPNLLKLIDIQASDSVVAVSTVKAANCKTEAE